MGKMSKNQNLFPERVELAELVNNNSSPCFLFRNVNLKRLPIILFRFYLLQDDRSQRGGRLRETNSRYCIAVLLA